MDDEGQVETISPAVRHDRWTFAILALNFASRVADVASDTFDQFTVAAMQHSNQLKYDRKFNDIVRKL
jgi:hypothetical protein